MIPETKCLIVKFPVGVSSLLLSTSSMFVFSPVVMASTQLSHTWPHSLLPSQNREWDIQTRAGLGFADQHLYARERSKDNPTLCKNIPQLSCVFLPQKDQGLPSSPNSFWPVSVEWEWLWLSEMVLVGNLGTLCLQGIAQGGLQFCSFSAWFEENMWKKQINKIFKKIGECIDWGIT